MTALTASTPHSNPTLPETLRIDDDGQEVQVCFRWVNPLGLGTALSLLLGAVGIMTLVARGSDSFLLRSTLLVLLGLGLYAALAVALNRTVLRANPMGLVVYHGPLPCPFVGIAGRRFARAEMTQFLVRASREGGPAALGLRLSNGREVSLLRLGHPSQALLIEHRLRSRVGGAVTDGEGPKRSSRDWGMPMFALGLFGLFFVLLAQQLLL